MNIAINDRNTNLWLFILVAATAPHGLSFPPDLEESSSNTYPRPPSRVGPGQYPPFNFFGFSQVAANPSAKAVNHNKNKVRLNGRSIAKAAR